jgi:hypothetical protein
MKKLFYFIVLPILVIAAIPITGVALMYDGSTVDTMPVHLYTEDADARGLLYKELDEALQEVSDDMEADLVYRLHQDIINIAIFEEIRKNINEDYLPTDDCEASSCKYIFATETEGSQVRVLGMWVTFEEDMFIGNVAIESQLGDGFTYQTSVKIQFSMKDNIDNYVVEFDRIQIGKLPLTKGLFSTILRVVDNQTSAFNRDEFEDALPVGNLDLEAFQIIIAKEELSEYVRNTSEGDQNVELVATLLDIIFENRLVQFELEEEVFEVKFRMSMLRNDPNTDLPLYLRDFDYVNFDPESYMTNRFKEFIFNQALTQESFLMLHERTFNKMIYHQMEGFENALYTYEYEDSEGQVQTFEMGLKGLWIEFKTETIESEEHLYLLIKGLFVLNDIPSLLIIRADDISEELDLVYTFDITSITLGEEASKTVDEYLVINDLEPFKAFLSDMEDFYFGYFTPEGNLVINTLRLTELIEDGTVDGVLTIDDITIVHGGIRIEISVTDPSLNTILNDFSNALNDVFSDPGLDDALQAALDTTNPGPEQDTYNQMMSIQDTINNEGSPTAEDVAALFESFDEMSPTSQQAFLDAVEGLIDPTIFEAFNNSFQD